MAPDLDVLVIGGGQAGLAMGYELAQRGRRSLIVDANPAVGDAWRSRWDSLRLFTAARFNDLPGKPFPGSRDRYPGRDEVADFLQAYAAEFELPVRLDTQVTRLTREHDFYVAATSGGTIEARQVVVATGPFQVPFIPPAAERLDPELAQLHSAGYRNPESLPPGKVLVVGAANSGIQIALELAETRTVELSVGREAPDAPAATARTRHLVVAHEDGAGRSHRRLAARPAALPARRRDRRRPARAAATRRADPARVTGASGRTVTFADDASAEYDAVVWATGFRVDHSWIEIPEVKDERGQVRHRRGVTPSPGLYMLGLTWQHKRTSALIGWVGEDAAFVADQIA